MHCPILSLNPFERVLAYSVCPCFACCVCDCVCQSICDTNKYRTVGKEPAQDIGVDTGVACVKAVFLRG
jgi:Na+-translocating ferredoxin:NAD+ oxidoreductase RnfC subunit